MALFRKHTWAVRVSFMAVCVALIATASVAMVAKKNRRTPPLAEKALAVDQTVPEAAVSPLLEVDPLNPLKLDPVTPPPPPPTEAPEPAPRREAAPKAVVKPPLPVVLPIPQPVAPLVSRGTKSYEKLGAWVDRFDIIDPEAALAEMSRRGVKTLYMQTGRYRDAEEIFDPARLGAWIDIAHAKNIDVVCWYVPGFGDMERDLARTRAAIEFTSPNGGHCDGFAPDIETGDFAFDRARFNAGIDEYSRRIREVAGDRPLGAIVVDAKNNERANGKWAGFPWKTIGEVYDVILPMAYWSVTKGPGCGNEYDAYEYINQVVEKTNALMGQAKPMHMIGGIANCQTVAETSGFVRAVKGKNLLGGSLYDYVTTQSSPLPLWAELAHLN